MIFTPQNVEKKQTKSGPDLKSSLVPLFLLSSNGLKKSLRFSGFVSLRVSQRIDFLNCITKGPFK